MNFYTDPDPGLGNSPYGSKEKKILFQFFTIYVGTTLKKKKISNF